MRLLDELCASKIYGETPGVGYSFSLQKGEARAVGKRDEGFHASPKPSKANTIRSCGSRIILCGLMLCLLDPLECLSRLLCLCREGVTHQRPRRPCPQALGRGHLSYWTAGDAIPQVWNQGSSPDALWIFGVILPLSWRITHVHRRQPCGPVLSVWQPSFLSFCLHQFTLALLLPGQGSRVHTHPYFFTKWLCDHTLIVLFRAYLHIFLQYG